MMQVIYAKGEKNQETIAVFKIIGKVSIFVLIGLAVLFGYTEIFM